MINKKEYISKNTIALKVLHCKFNRMNPDKKISKNDFDEIEYKKHVIDPNEKLAQACMILDYCPVSPRYGCLNLQV